MADSKPRTAAKKNKRRQSLLERIEARLARIERKLDARDVAGELDQLVDVELEVDDASGERPAIEVSELDRARAREAMRRSGYLVNDRGKGEE